MGLESSNSSPATPVPTNLIFGMPFITGSWKTDCNKGCYKVENCRHWYFGFVFHLGVHVRQAEVVQYALVRMEEVLQVNSLQLHDVVRKETWLKQKY